MNPFRLARPRFLVPGLVALLTCFGSPILGQEAAPIPQAQRDSLFNSMAQYVVSTNAFCRYFGFDAETGRIDLAAARSPEPGDFTLGQRSIALAGGMVATLRRLVSADGDEQRLLEIVIVGLHIPMDSQLRLDDT